MKWFFLSDDNQDPEADRFVSHCVPEPLREAVVLDLRRRGLKRMKLNETKIIQIDFPGIIMVDRRWIFMNVDELKVGIPASDFALFFDRLDSLRPRVLGNGKSYYKLHTWLRCICLTPTQRASVLRKMGAKLNEAKRVGEEDNEEFDRRLAKRPHPNIRVPLRAKKNLS